jgi:Flp pilus assembly protein TadD
MTLSRSMSMANGYYENAILEYDEAIDAFDKAIEINPEYAGAWNNKGVALKLIGRTKESDAAYAKAKEPGYSD